MSGSVRRRFARAFILAVLVTAAGGLLGPVGVASAAGCTESWTATSGGAWNDPSNWSPHGVPGSSDDVCITVSGTYTVTLPSSVSVNSITVGSSGGTGLQLLDITGVPGQNAGLSIAADSAVDSSGEIELDSQPGGGTATLSGAASATLTDDGIVFVAHDGSNTDDLQANLDVGASGTVEVAGPLVVNTATATTNGGTFTVDPTGSVSMTNASATFVNDASLVQNGSLTLTAGASWTQNAGAASQTGTVQLYSGELTDESGAGSFSLTDSAKLAGTVPAGQTVTVAALAGHNAALALQGASVTNDGSIVLDDVLGGGTSSLTGPAPLVNDGTLTSEVNSGNTTRLETDLTNASGATLSVTSGTLVMDTGNTLTNDGDLAVAAGAGLSASNGSDQIINNAAGLNAVTNSGTIELTGGSALTQNGAETGNPVQIFGGALTDQSGAGAFWLVDSCKLAGTIPSGQTVTVEALAGHNATAQVQGTVTNRGRLVLDSAASGGAATLTAASTGTPELDNFGALVDQSESSNTNSLAVTLVNESSGSVEVASATLADSAGASVTNDGTVTTDAPVGMGATPTLLMNSGADVFVNDGVVADNGAVVLSSGAAWTQTAPAPETGNAVEIFGGLLTDRSGGGSFELVDGSQLAGTVPAGQTVTAAALAGHNATVSLEPSTLFGTTDVTVDGSLVLDDQSGGGAATVAGPGALVNDGTVTVQSENAPTSPVYLQADVTNDAGGVVDVRGGELSLNTGSTLSNAGSLTVAAGAELLAGEGSDLVVNQGAVSDAGSVVLTSGASWTQESAGAAQSGNAVEIFSGLLTDRSGGGSFELVDGSELAGTVPAGQTVTAAALAGHNATVSLEPSTLFGTTDVTVDGSLVLDDQSSGGAATVAGPGALVNDGTVTVQSENAPTSPVYLQTDLTNGPTGTLDVAGGRLYANTGSTVLNHGVVSIAAGAQLNFDNSSDTFIGESDGTIEPDIASAGSFGTINLSSGASFTVGGTLSPVLEGGYAPAIGTAFDVITGPRAGTFASVTNGFRGDYSVPNTIAVIVLDTTTTSLGAVPAGSSFGEPVTLTATVTPGAGGSGPPSGLVSFFDDGVALGSSPVSTSGGVTTATFVTSVASPLPVGSDLLTASYGGDGNFAGSSTVSAASEVVAEAVPTVVVQSSVPSSMLGDAVTLTAAVSGPVGVVPQPTGSVTFSVGATVLGSAPLSTVGGVATASLTTSALPVGADQVGAAFGGDANYAAATAAAPASVSVAPPSTTTTGTGTTSTGTTGTGTTGTGTGPSGTGGPTSAGSTSVPPPVLVTTVDAAPVLGTVLVRLPGTDTFVPLATLKSIPIGSTVDATHGSVTITAATPGGGTETGTFFDGEFILRQTRAGQLVAVLTGGSFAACAAAPKPGRTPARLTADGKPPTKKKVIRSLWANVHGNFSTQGAYGSAAVSGTEWFTADRCDGTYFHVARHVIIITSFKLHNRRTRLTQGHSYLAPV